MDRIVRNNAHFTFNCTENFYLEDSVKRKHAQANPVQEDSPACPYWASPHQTSTISHPAQGQLQESHSSSKDISDIDNQWNSDENIAFEKDKRPRILVVGDEHIHTTIKDHLALQPYLLQYITPTRAALQNIELNLPDLVIYDAISLPFDGAEISQEVNSDNKAPCLPIIFLVERSQMPEVISDFEAGRNDYLVKPFTKHELLIRIRNQLVLLNANERLTKLRVFTKQIAGHKNLDVMLYRTFRLLHQEPFLTDVTLFKGDTIHYSNCKERPAIEAVFDQTKHTTQKETFYTLWHENCHCFLFKLSEGQSWTFIVRIASAALLNLEKEYIKSIFSQICIIKDNLNFDICDPTTITNLYAVTSKLEHLLFVKSAKQYVELYVKRHRPELLAISLKKVDHYFKDRLFRVHRSYLVNPNEIQQIRRKNRGRYEILIGEHVIPVGELYLSALRSKFSHWFKPP